MLATIQRWLARDEERREPAPISERPAAEQRLLDMVRAAVEAPPAPAAPPAPPDVSGVRVGQKIGNLTKITGDLWIDLDTVQILQLRPADGCGAEIHFKGTNTIHLNAYGKACLEKFINQEQSQISELERLTNLDGKGETQ